MKTKSFANLIRKLAFGSIALLGAVLMLGCETIPDTTANAEGPNGVFKPAKDFNVSTYQYIIAPPDEVTVRAPGIKELDAAPRVVGPDGRVTFNLIGAVDVAGLSPDQVAEKLRTLMGKYYKDPEIKVDVKANSKFFYVLDAGATRQGKYAYIGNNTVLNALGEAGFNDQGWPRKISVARPSEHAVVVVDFEKFYLYGDLSQNYLLEKDDIIRIPRSPLASWAFKTSQIAAPITGGAQILTSGNTVAGGVRP